jgi:hypothetical protein
VATVAQKIRAEHAGRTMLEEAGLPAPDQVEYGYTCIRFFWNEPRVVLVIEIDEPPEGFQIVGEYLDDLVDDPESSRREEGEAA